MSNNSVTDIRQPFPEDNKEMLRQLWSQEPESIDEFIRYLDRTFEFDYGTICHAIAAAGIAAMKRMDKTSQGGITGFQANAIMWIFVRNWGGYGGPMQLINYEQMLFPQSAEHFAKEITPDCFEWLKTKARDTLTNAESLAPEARAHLISIIEGNVPFGYTVKKVENESS